MDRAGSRVRRLLLASAAAATPFTAASHGNQPLVRQNSSFSSIGDDYSSSSGNSQSPINCRRRFIDRIEEVLSSFKSENEALTSELEDAKTDLGMTRAEKADAQKLSAKLESTIRDLSEEIHKLQDRRNNAHAFDSSFPSHSDITDRLEESLARSLCLNEEHGGLEQSSSSEREEGRDILAPSPQPHMQDPSSPEEEEDGKTTAAASSSTKDTTRKGGGESLNVPSLADAQAEDDEEHPMEELTNALDSLNEFDYFLMDLGLDENQS